MQAGAFLFIAGALFCSSVQACGPTLYTVQGTSMVPLLAPGARFETVPPECLGHGIARGDIVVFDSGADPHPLVKRVVAAAGDEFSVASGALFVNAAPALTGGGAPYRLDPARLKMLALYERDYGGVVPPAAFLVMGERTGGTTDSSRIGLVALSDIRGVAVPGDHAALAQAATRQGGKP